jgi:hypothetical protein
VTTKTDPLEADQILLSLPVGNEAEQPHLFTVETVHTLESRVNSKVAPRAQEGTATKTLVREFFRSAEFRSSPSFDTTHWASFRIYADTR